jgi:hypothetical protein
MKIRISRHHSSRPIGRSLAAAILLALVLLPLTQGVALAQSAPPPPPGPPPVILPPPGTPVVQPNYPTVPPACVAPISPNGTVAVIPPAGNGAVAQITIDLLDYMTTLLVPAHPAREIAVRIDAPPEQTPPAELPQGDRALVFAIDLYFVDTCEEIHSHTLSLQLGVRPPEGIDPASLTLLRFDEDTGQYETLTTTVDTESRVLRAEITETSPFVLAFGAAGGAAPVPTAVIPSGLPRTGGGDGSSGLLPALLALAGGFLAAFGLLRLRGARARR